MRNMPAPSFLAMPMFAIFLCMAIGHVFGDLQRVEIGKDDSKAKEDAKESPSPYVKEAINLDKYLQSKDEVQVPTQSGISNEIEPDEQSSSLGLGSSFTSGAYKVKKKGRKLQSETREAQSFVQHSDRNTSAKNDSKKFRSFSVKTGKDHSNKTRRSNRMKRGQSETFNGMMEPGSEVLHPKTLLRKVRSNSLSEEPEKEISNNAKLEETSEEKLLDITNPRGQDARPVTIPRTGVSRKATVSHGAMRSLLNKLPEALKSKLLITDDAEKVVLENYVKSDSVPNKSLHAYDFAKKDERELLQQLLANMSVFLPSYKSIRKGVAWNHTILSEKYRKISKKLSTALEKNEASMKDELTSLDSLLIGPGQGGAPIKVGASKLHETEWDLTKTHRTEEEERRAQAEKAEKQMERENAKSEEAETRMRKDSDDDEDDDDEEYDYEDEDDEDEDEEEEEEDEEDEDEEEEDEDEEEEDEEEDEAEEEEKEDDEAEESKEKKKGGKKKKEKEDDEAGESKGKKKGGEKKKEKDEEDEGEKEGGKKEKGGKEKPKSKSGYNDPPVTCNVKLLLTKSEIKEMIDTHNDARRREKGAGMLKLKWDPIAAKLAQQKASACEFGHSMLTDCTGRGLGQSIWANNNHDEKTFIKRNITEVTYAWADENKEWDYSAKKCNEGKACGHWEMLTGDQVQSVGCGAARCVSMKFGTTARGHANYVVCDYFPYYTKFEVGKACSKCATTAATTPEKGYRCEKKLCATCNPKKDKDCTAASGGEDIL